MHDRKIAANYFASIVVPYREDECLTWPFYRAPNGYAMMYRDGQPGCVSRFACEAVNGPPPSPQHQAAHNCGNGHLGCVSPVHVRWATPAENEADKVIHRRRRADQREPRPRV